MEKTKQSMKGVVAGRNVTQQSDINATDQEMNSVSARGDVEQAVRSQHEENSLSVRGFGNAKGKWAVVVIGILFALFLVWKFLIAR